MDLLLSERTDSCTLRCGMQARSEARRHTHEAENLEYRPAVPVWHGFDDVLLKTSGSRRLNDSFVDAGALLVFRRVPDPDVIRQAREKRIVSQHQRNVAVAQHQERIVGWARWGISDPPASYKWDKTLFSVSATYGSGLRSGFANMDHVPAYLNVNLGTSREFELVSAEKPLTLRFDIVNLFDRIYELRSGTGIGVFAPQYGARRGFFVGLSQKL